MHPFIASIHCFFLAFVFVSSLYIWNLIPKFANKERDDPISIRCRFTSVFFVCLFSPLYVSFIIPYFTPFPIFDITINDIINTFIALVITMIWFLGPLIQYHYSLKKNFIYDTNNKPKYLILSIYYIELKAIIYSFSFIHQWRNIIVAPWGEEWVFRALMIPILLNSGLTVFWAGFIAPFFFGVAHIHHIINHIFFDKKPVLQSIILSLFQFAYTTIFGWYSAFLFIHTNTVLAPFIAHVFCNYMGFPNFSGISEFKEKTIIQIGYIVGLIGIIIILFNPQIFYLIQV